MQGQSSLPLVSRPRPGGVVSQGRHPTEAGLLGVAGPLQAAMGGSGKARSHFSLSRFVRFRTKMIAVT